MERILVLLIFKVLLVADSFAQQDIREQVYVHLNSQTFLSGETMYLSVYCNSRITGKPSGMSKILYVEVIGKEGPVHQQKIRLEEGRGNAEIFISSAIPSGQYYLIAYTRWMKNFNDYFQSPVLIINPFESYPKELVAQKSEIELFPLQNPLIAGLENVVAMKIGRNNPSDLKGRIINNRKAEEQLKFDIDHFGFAKIRFTPQKGQSYQAIFEDEAGQLSIIDLPEVIEKGSLVTYKEENGQLSLRYQETGQHTPFLKLSLFSDGISLYEAEVAPNEYYTVPDNLPDGVYHAQFMDQSGKILAERAILISAAKLKRSKVSKTYQQRERVTIDPQLAPGHYSISVRKSIDPEFEIKRHAVLNNASNPILQSPAIASPYLLSANKVDPEAFMLASKSHVGKPNSEQLALLPEIREELLLGKLTDREEKPVADKKLALSFPGNPFQLRIGESDEQGDFIIPFQSSVVDTEAIITVLDFNNEFKIQLHSPYLDDYPDFNYSMPPLDSNVVAKMVARSIRVQIENAYFDFSKRESSTNEWVKVIPFYETYLLDEYKRFPTLKETITEFVISANVRENREHVIKTAYFPGLAQREFPPLVLLDGVPVSGDKLINFSPYQVKSIRVVPNRYFLGPHVMDGIVSLETFGHDLGEFRLDLEGAYKRVQIGGVNAKGNFHFPDYSETQNPNRPDQRDQLYWNPDYNPAPGNQEFSFYTSDVPGEYEIVIEGFTDEGRPVSKVYTFMVDKGPEF